MSCRGSRVPVTIITDCSTKFTGDVWSCMCSQLHISHQTTTSYHSESNSLTERLHRSLKAALRAKCQTASWSSELPLILLGLWSAPRECDTISSIERMFGIPPILPGEFRRNPKPGVLNRFPASYRELLCTSYYTQSAVPAVPPALASCRFVFIRVDGSGRHGPSLHWSFLSTQEI